MRTRGIAAVGAAASVGAVAAVAWPFTVDDAYVTLRIAENLVAGRGWAMNPGSASDGVTGPLWIAPFVLGEAVGLDGMLVAKLAGAACVLCAVFLTVSALARRAGGSIAAPAGAVLLAVQPTLAIWSVAGLETGAATLALTVLALGVVERRPAARSRLLALVVAAASIAWLRPELLPAAFVLALGGRARLAVLGAVGLGAVAVVGFRLAMFGRVLPLAVEAKPGDVGLGAHYVAFGALVITGVAGIALAALGARRAGTVVGAWSRERVLGVALVVHAAAVAIAGGDWMPGFRLVAPAIPVYAYLAALGVARVAAAPARRAPRKGRARRALAMALLGVALAVPGLDLVVQLPEARDAGARRDGEGRRLARWLRAHARSVALVDVGYLGWASGARVIDLGGITDPEVARRPGGHLSKEIDPGWLEARAPDAIVLHAAAPPAVAEDGTLRTLAAPPVERRLAAMPFVRDRYRVSHLVDYAPGYVYVVLVRR